MPTLHVRNVPETLYERLQQRARAENRSLSAEVIYMLEMALAEPVPSVAEILERLERRRMSYTPSVNAPDSVQLLREDRDR
ncbi:MAG: Arc family DNA-binding protein [Anaerolineae bacterium]|nr:Arc family DNA-binding protein [Anaerolineae bacterium]